MNALGHSIGRQTLAVDVPSEELARALLPRIRDFNRERVVPALERILDAFGVEGRHVRLGRIDVDLGRVPLDELDTVALARLEAGLRRAVTLALTEAEREPTGERHVRTEGEARRELLEHYLLRGTLPRWGPRPSRFVLEDLVQTLADDDAEALVAVVRRLAHRPHVLERMAAQVGEPLLRRWIGLLEPRHASVIVAYVADLRHVHRTEPLVALSSDDFTRVLWVLAQAYLLREPGTQFNRRSFLRGLLRGLAVREGLDYAAVLATLRRALERTAGRGAWHVSLPAVVGDLVREMSNSGPAAPPAPPAAPPRGEPPGGLSGQALAERLLAHLRSPSATGTIESRRLLRRLLWRHPARTRALLAAVAAEAGPFAELAGLARRPLFARLVALMVTRADEAALLVLIAETTMRLARGRGASSAERLRRAWLEVAASAARSHSLGVDVLRRGLVEALGPDAPAKVRESLRSRVEREVAAGRLGRHERALLDAAFTGLAPGPGVTAAPGDSGGGLAAGRGPSGLVPALSGDPRPDESPGPFDDANAAGEIALPLDLVRRQAQDPARREEWARTLSDASLLRIVAALEPRRHAALLAAAEVLAAAWAEALPPGRKSLAGRALFWTFVLEFLARCAPPARSVEQLAGAFSAFFAERYRAAFPGGGAEEDVGAGLLDRAARRARRAGNRTLVAVLERGRGRLLAVWGPGPSDCGRPDAGQGPRGRRVGDLRGNDGRGAPGPGPAAEDAEAVRVENAGLVLAGVFLPFLFQSLDLLVHDEEGRPRWRHPSAAARAVHLLQYLADGTTSAAEPALALNKVLCGLDPSTAVARVAELEEGERGMGDRLLRALLDRWKIVSNTSVAGLRETFLQREGRLSRSADGWRLQVQRRTLDLLVDEVPWSISVIVQPWMALPLHVTW